MKIENTAQGQKAIALKLKVVYEINGTTVTILFHPLINLFHLSKLKKRLSIVSLLHSKKLHHTYS